MKVYLPESVFEAGLQRMRRLFQEFNNIIINCSGGKDSTVVLNLALIVAEEMDRLPLKVLFIDQEAEWSCVIDYVRVVMSDPRVEPHWLQVPFKLFNATSTVEPWLNCWEEGAEWMREKEPDSIHQNVYGTNRFHPMFDKVLAYEFPDAPAICLTGVRCEESPARLNGLTAFVTYRDITWGKAVDKRRGHYVFHPLYDWSYTDIWKSIHDHGWPYCALYDHMYRHGVRIQDMRVSNLHHETAVQSLFFLQEVEGGTWNMLTRRLPGIEVTRHINRGDMFAPSKLPSMFACWRDYVDHLIETLITVEPDRLFFADAFAKARRRYFGYAGDKLEKVLVRTLLRNDLDLTLINNFESSPEIANLRKVVRHGGDLSVVRSPQYRKAVERMMANG